MKKVLITSFGAFSTIENNPTEILVNYLMEKSNLRQPEIELYEKNLEVSYSKCEKVFDKLIADFQPEIVVSFAVNTNLKNQLLISEKAFNNDKPCGADSDGITRPLGEIVAGAPKIITTKVDIKKLLENTQNCHNPTVVLKDVDDGYVCNHLYYYGLYKLQKANKNQKMLFVHIGNFDEENTLQKTADVCEKIIKFCCK